MTAHVMTGPDDPVYQVAELIRAGWTRDEVLAQGWPAELVDEVIAARDEVRRRERMRPLEEARASIRIDDLTEARQAELEQAIARSAARRGHRRRRLGVPDEWHEVTDFRRRWPINHDQARTRARSDDPRWAHYESMPWADGARGEHLYRLRPGTHAGPWGQPIEQDEDDDEGLRVPEHARHDDQEGDDMVQQIIEERMAEALEAVAEGATCEQAADVYGVDVDELRRRRRAQLTSAPEPEPEPAEAVEVEEVDAQASPYEWSTSVDLADLEGSPCAKTIRARARRDDAQWAHYEQRAVTDEDDAHYMTTHLYRLREGTGWDALKAGQATEIERLRAELRAAQAQRDEARRQRDAAREREVQAQQALAEVGPDDADQEQARQLRVERDAERALARKRAGELEEMRDELARERARGDSLERKIQDLTDERDALLEAGERDRQHRTGEAHRVALMREELEMAEDWLTAVGRRLDEMRERLERTTELLEQSRADQVRAVRRAEKLGHHLDHALDALRELADEGVALPTLGWEVLWACKKRWGWE